LNADRRSVRPFQIALMIAVVIGGLGGLLAAELQQGPQARPRFIPPREQARDFRLRDEDGKWRTLEDAHGDVVVLTFLYWVAGTCAPSRPRTSWRRSARSATG
jgi:hypothetical protein